jgi:GTP pyrophosphokinase
MTSILEKILQNPAYTESDKKLIEKAFELAKTAHLGQKRLSGEEYLSHPLHVAYFLSELGMDATTVVAGILHDTIEDTPVTHKDIEKEFGKDIAFLVEGVTKLSKIEHGSSASWRSDEKKSGVEHLNSLKKMIFAMAEDIRVMLIKLADRYHNMETLKYKDGASQKKTALETLEIYAPIAARLGMGRLKGQLEDMAFPYVYSLEYSQLVKKVKEKYADRIKYIERTKPIIKRHLTDAGISVLEMNSRAKHYYSLYHKMLQHDMDIEKIFDLVAMRIMVPDIKSCYEALGVIHKFYKPLPGLIKDYIALPKPNGYQSLHTTIFCEKGRVVEIQIRTENMHEYAENGIAAHWAYSEGGKKKGIMANVKEVQWVNQLKNFLKEVTPGEGLSNLKIDFFKNRIFALTPKGEVKDLPDGATPVDFSYAIHTDLGHMTRGAKINGKIFPLHHELKNGDVVEIIKGKDKKPSFDWLKFVKTTEAKKKIKSFFKDLNEEELPKQEESKTKQTKKIVVTVEKKGEPIIQGQKGLLYKLAKCCNPTLKNKIKGYMTLNRGVSIHVATCSNLKTKNGHNARLLNASWSDHKK